MMQGRRPQPRRAEPGSCKGLGQILSSTAPLKWDEWVNLHVTALKIRTALASGTTNTGCPGLRRRF